MYCGNCGALLPDGQMLCPACGVDQSTGPDEVTMSKHWYFLQPAPEESQSDDEQRGPYPFAVILSEIHTGKITDTTLVWYPELPNWMPASEALARYMKDSSGSSVWSSDKDNVFRMSDIIL